jgi:NAD(P)-dependent dehydrogenase (short-subunit alcohol dehydrogenase family)
MSPAASRIALVTGAAKGIGLEIVRGLATKGYVVYLTARDPHRARAAAESLRGDRPPVLGGDVRALVLDVRDADSIRRAVAHVEREAGKLDVLANNAGVLLDEHATALDSPLDAARATFETNFFGPWAVTQAFAPLLRRGRSARVVNVSSTAGSMTDLASNHENFDDFGPPAYCASKAALNALTILQARAFARDRVLVNCCCPGWVKTDMGGPAAPLSPAHGADTPIWLATLPDGGPTGGFFAGRKPIAW